MFEFEKKIVFSMIAFGVLIYLKYINQGSQS